MAILRCKMCGGSINLEHEQNVCTCDFCGTMQTLPLVKDNEKLMALHNRANTLRMKCEFDKALVTYENIISENNDDAEAHWGILLCKYGIEYVDDSVSGKKIPTCHRTQIKSIYDDIDYKLAIENSDVVSRSLYEEEAKYIDSIQKRILSITQNEEPYDIFICYKETDSSGKRTRDSIIAQELYEELTKRKYKVFFAKITLESKLGSQYEPYIFSALRSSKIMLVLGTKPEYFNAVWVKNEWSRFLMMLNEDGSDKYIIPCYRDMDAYEMPDELLSFQSQDMNKLGFVQDLTRGIDKIFNRRQDEDISNKLLEKTRIINGVNVEALITRCEILISEGNFKEAKTKLDSVLDNDPENGKAYILMLLIDLKVTDLEELNVVNIDFSFNNNYLHAIKYVDEKTKTKLENYKNQMLKNLELNRIYDEALKLMGFKRYSEAIGRLETIKDFKDASSKVIECKNHIENIKADSYHRALVLVDEEKYSEAIEILKSLGNYKDSIDKIDELKGLLSKQLLERYELSQKYINEYEYEKAKLLLEQLKGYKDSEKLLNEVNELIPLEEKYQRARKLIQDKKLLNQYEGVKLMDELARKNYRDSKELSRVSASGTVMNFYKPLLKICLITVIIGAIALIFIFIMIKSL